jgi:hypothetical protein
MLEANRGGFPSDPDALRKDWLGADWCVAAIVPERAHYSRSRCHLPCCWREAADLAAGGNPDVTRAVQFGRE